MMNTKIYFYSNNAYNAVVFTQDNGFYLMTEHISGEDGKEIDLYADDAIEQVKSLYTSIIADNMMDLSGLCNGDCVFAGDFTADAPEEDAILIAEYNDEDYAPYVDGLY